MYDLSHKIVSSFLVTEGISVVKCMTMVLKEFLFWEWD